jgi:hypothetical protein
MQKKKSREETLLFRYLFTVRQRFGKAGETLPGKNPDCSNTDLVKHHEGYRHHHLVDNIRRGGKDGSNDEINENGIFSIAVEKGDINEPCLGNKNHKNRHFKNHSKSQEQSGGQVKIFAHSRKGS